ncbi:MAG: DUF4097 family beta strand repeat-containing protein [Bacteroidota bacterium]
MLLIGCSVFGQEEMVNIPFKSSDQAKSLVIDLNEGEVSIVGTDRTDVLVRYQSHRSQSEGEQEGMEEKSKGLSKVSSGTKKIEMSSKENQIMIRSDSYDANLSFAIEVPKTIDLNIDIDFSGNVSIQDIQGNVNVELASGDIRIQGLNGLLNASSDEGDIHVQFVNIPDPKTMMWMTTSGDIDVSLPSDYSAKLKVKADKGDVYSDLNIQFQEKVERVQDTDEDGSFRYINNSWTYGTLNAGGPEIIIITKLGDIYLRKL